MAEDLMLRAARDENGKRFTPARWQTSWGTKTAEGVFRSVVDQIHKRVTAYALSKEQ